MTTGRDGDVAPQDLLAHAELLDGTVAVTPVLLLRFGAVLAEADVVIEELPAAHPDEFTAALDEFDRPRPIRRPGPLRRGHRARGDARGQPGRRPAV